MTTKGAGSIDGVFLKPQMVAVKMLQHAQTCALVRGLQREGAGGKKVVQHGQWGSVWLQAQPLVSIHSHRAQAGEPHRPLAQT